jgi:hypothetical protein
LFWAERITGNIAGKRKKSPKDYRNVWTLEMSIELITKTWDTKHHIYMECFKKY